MHLLQGLVFAAIAAAIWFGLSGPLADRLADRDVEGWGRRDD